MATGIPILLCAWWAALAAGWLGRRAVWRAASPTILLVAASLQSPVVPTFWGYQVRAPDGRGARWTFGPRGARTRWRDGARSRAEPGFTGGPWVDAAPEPPAA